MHINSISDSIMSGMVFDSMRRGESNVCIRTSKLSLNFKGREKEWNLEGG